MFNPDCDDPERMRRKADQAWDMAGLANMDGDKQDCARLTKEAQQWEALLREHML